MVLVYIKRRKKWGEEDRNRRKRRGKERKVEEGEEKGEREERRERGSVKGGRIRRKTGG